MGVAEHDCHFNGAINIKFGGALFLGHLIDLNSKDNHPQLQIWVGQLAEANGRVSRENAHR